MSYALRIQYNLFYYLCLFFFDGVISRLKNIINLNDRNFQKEKKFLKEFVNVKSVQLINFIKFFFPYLI